MVGENDDKDLSDQDLDAPDDGYDRIGSGLEPEAAGEAEGIRSFTLPALELDGTEHLYSWKGLIGSVAGLAILLMFHAFALRSWIGQEGRPPSWDQAIQLEIAMDAHRALDKGDWGALFVPTPKPGMPPFPPLHHLLVRYAMDEADPAASALGINFFYMILLCVSLYLLARRGGGDWAGLAAALLFSCMPEVQEHFRDHLIDLPLTAWVAAAYTALFYSDRFEEKVPSALFGILLSAAMLTKWSAFTYFFPVLGILLGAIGEARRKNNIKIAAALFAALSFPWYLAQWSVLLPRLVGASSDNAVSFFTYAGMTSYLRQMPIGMEFPLMVMGLWALARRPIGERGREMQGTLLLWFATALAFWTLVPNRQLRYLLPALPPLVVLVAMTFDKKYLAGICALQLFAAANYPHGWVPPITQGLFPGFNFSLFRGDRAKKEDWRIEEILRKADELRDQERPFSNMALLANDVRFNGATLNWELDRLGIAGVKMRGINRRICEFAEFLLTKTGSLGPETVVNQLPSVRRDILLPGSWFDRGYAKVAEWDLPDQSKAVLYQRRHLSKAPIKEGLSRIDFIEESAYIIKGADIDFGRWDRIRGVFPKVTLAVESLVIRGLEVRDLQMEMEDLIVVPVEESAKGADDPRGFVPMDVRFLGMKKLTLLSGWVSDKAVEKFLLRRLPGAVKAKVLFDETLVVATDPKGISLAAEVDMRLIEAKKALLIEVLRVSVFHVPVPAALLGPARRYRLGFAPNPELPFQLSIPALTLVDGRLRIGG